MRKLSKQRFELVHYKQNFIRKHLKYSNGKRILDFILAIIILFVLGPLMLLLAILIKLDSKGPAFFIQKRLGKKQRLFTIFKYRTMIVSDDQSTTLHENDIRITRVGAFLRKTSLDELPQLINIIKGEMSFIGPRPILLEEFKPYKDNILYQKRFDIRPGLFCIVDINLRAKATRDQQFELDVNYANKMTLRLDLFICIKVFVNVIKRKNIYRMEVPNEGEKQLDKIKKDGD